MLGYWDSWYFEFRNHRAHEEPIFIDKHAPKVGTRKPPTAKQLRDKSNKNRAQKQARRIQRLTPNPTLCQRNDQR